MNVATQLYYHWLGLSLTGMKDYKAPHANRGTPKSRKKRLSGLTLPKLFKGHRP